MSLAGRYCRSNVASAGVVLKHGDIRRWNSKPSINTVLKGIRAGLASAEGLFLLKTATNTQQDWIKAGRA
jgi:hypothetical protein